MALSPFQTDSTLAPEDSVHARAFRGFVALARFAIVCTPVVLALVLFWASRGHQG